MYSYGHQNSEGWAGWGYVPRGCFHEIIRFGSLRSDDFEQCSVSHGETSEVVVLCWICVGWSLDKTEAWQTAVTAAKAIRMLHMFRTVWRLVYGLLTSGNTMLSTFFILLLTLYIFACLGAVHPTGLEMARKLARLGNLQPSSRRLQ